MIRIAFLGSDSTHATAFGKRIASGWSDQARVVSIYGDDGAQAAGKAADLGIPRVAASVDDALAGVDLAMVIGRFGDSHFGPAAAALKAGIPTFVDKPFTTNLDEARRLVELAGARGVPLSSSSPLRFAPEVVRLKQALLDAGDRWTSVVVTAPANCADLGPDPRFESAFFYGIHGIEVLLELVGHGVEEVRVSYGGTVTTAHVAMNDGRTAVFQLIRDIPEFYAVDVHTRGASERVTIDLDGAYYAGVLDYLLRDFVAARASISLDSTMWAISILDAIEHRHPLVAPR